MDKPNSSKERRYPTGAHSCFPFSNRGLPCFHCHNGNTEFSLTKTTGKTESKSTILPNLYQARKAISQLPPGIPEVSRGAIRGGKKLRHYKFDQFFSTTSYMSHTKSGRNNRSRSFCFPEILFLMLKVLHHLFDLLWGQAAISRQGPSFDVPESCV